YQVEAASKVIGGVDYTFALRGDVLTPVKPVPAAEQRRALDAVLATLTPGALALPDSILKLIPPRPPEYPQTREDFRRRTSPTFDSLAPAEAAANHTVAFLFDASRAARLVEYHAHDALFPGFDEVVDRIFAATWKAPHTTGYDAEIQRVVNHVVLYDLMSLAADDNASSQVRAIASLKLDELKTWLEQQLPQTQDEGWRAADFYNAQRIKQFQLNPKDFDLTRPATPPDGMPIGMPFGIGDGWDDDGGLWIQ
ncbi:MAG: zinc-dependent metalloprotease, partial [Stellaceae bacterium]